MSARLTRKKVLLGGGAALLALVGGRTAAAAALSYPEGDPGLRYRFSTLEEGFAQVKALAQKPGIQMGGRLGFAHVLEHCAQSIEYSITGYPENKPLLVRRTVGRLVHAHFVHQGYMKHGLGDPIPGAPALRAATVEEGLQQLEAAVARFLSHPGPLAPHFVYDTLSKAEYDRVHAMHLANHMAASY